jgi:hypothetical protein
MERQTAIEWLIEQILEIPLEEATNVAHLKKYVNKLTVLERAKEMENEEAENKLVDELVGFQIFLNDLGFDCDWDWEDAAKQYNETYKNKQL